MPITIGVKAMCWVLYGLMFLLFGIGIRQENGIAAAVLFLLCGVVGAIHNALVREEGREEIRALRLHQIMKESE